ncbi:MAG: electron transport complex subunit RsxC [Sedimentisphaerales bacterium]|nr:electron transport complex subunit RsxC [Sedimentisphaerales bacterium]
MSASLTMRGGFPGGVHPSEKKELTAESPIKPGPAVKQAAVLLSQHTGAICKPAVKEGESVQAGQVVGDSDAFISAPVHSPIDGKVALITLQSHPVIGRAPAVIIVPDAVNPAKRPQPKPQERFPLDLDIEKYTPQQITTAARKAGIVGLGGAGFPTAVKLEPNPEKPKDFLIINGCECEPYITCDYRVMLEWTNQVITGIRLARKATGHPKTIVAIEDNKPKAVEALGNALKRAPGCKDINVIELKTKYPQGGERQLIKSVLDRFVPTGGIPPMIGVVVLNVATAAAIADAVMFDSPLTHRVVTVTGEAIARPGNYYVAIGTPVKELIDFCGGVTQPSAKVVIGGPMMGIAIADLSTPVTKTTGAVTVLTKEQIGTVKFTRRQTPCIHCGRCLQVCPERLNPTRIAHAVKNNLMDIAQSYFINACIECGCCSYICPANIELTGLIRTGKIYLARQKKLMPS